MTTKHAYLLQHMNVIDPNIPQPDEAPLAVPLVPQGSRNVYSGSDAYNEEQRIDHERWSAGLDRFRLDKAGGLPGSEKGPFHASGHMDGPGMERPVETIAPGGSCRCARIRMGWF